MIWPWWLAGLLLATPPATVNGDLSPVGPVVWVDGGKRLAFVATVGGEAAWYVTGLDGESPPTELRWEPRPESAATVWWHPDGRRVAYAARRNGKRTLLMGGLDGEEPTPFAVVGSVHPLDAAWSPDGRMLAFGLRAEPGSAKPYDLFYCQANGAGGSRVPLDSPPVGISWSGDAKYLAFSTQSLGRHMLFCCDLEKQIAKSISAHLTVVPESVAWAPDNRNLAFNGALDPTTGLRLFVSRAVGQLIAERVERPGYVDRAPAVFSPDGQWLAWTVGPQGAPTPAPLVLGRLRTLSLAVRVSPANAAEPAFSPDGAWLVFVSVEATSPRRGKLLALRPEEPGTLHTIDADDNAGQPTFSPDGTRLAWLAGTTDKPTLKVMTWPPE